MADPKDTKSAAVTSAQPTASVVSSTPAQSASTEAKRNYRAKHRIVGADGEIRRGTPMRLTDAEARALGDAVEPQR